jgi:hypothetical protein
MNKRPRGRDCIPMFLTSRHEPSLSTKVVGPLCMAPVSFEQVLSNKLHSTLVIRPIASKKVSNIAFVYVGQTNRTTSSTIPYRCVWCKAQIVTHLHTSNSVTASHDMSSNNSIIVQGTREKICILTNYQEKFGSEYPELIVTRKKGKISNNTSSHCARMRPSLDRHRVGDLHLYNVITTIIKECRVILFSKEDLIRSSTMSITT